MSTLNGYLGSWRYSPEEEAALTEGHGCSAYDGSCKRSSFCDFAGEFHLDIGVQFDLYELWNVSLILHLRHNIHQEMN